MSILVHSCAEDDSGRLLDNSWDLAYQQKITPHDSDVDNIVAIFIKPNPGSCYSVQQHFYFSTLLQKIDYDDDWMGGSATLTVDKSILKVVKIYPKLWHIVKAHSKFEYKTPYTVKALKTLLDHLEGLYGAFRMQQQHLAGTRIECRLVTYTLPLALQYLQENCLSLSAIVNHIEVVYKIPLTDPPVRDCRTTMFPVREYLLRVGEILELARSHNLEKRDERIRLTKIERQFAIDLVGTFGIARKRGTKQNDPSAWWLFYEPFQGSVPLGLGLGLVSVFNSKQQPFQDSVEDKLRVNHGLSK